MAAKLLRVSAISLLVLFFELCLIRWLPSQVRALAYFKNLVLISSFLGLGLGFLLRQRWRWLPALAPLLLLAEIGAALWLGGYRITGQENAGEHLWLLYFDLPPDAPLFPLSVAIPLFYLLNTLTFVPLGQWLAGVMSDVGDSILAYVANVAGSIAGTLLVVALSFAEWGPRAWFIPALCAYAVLVRRQRGAAGLALLVAAALVWLPLDHPDTRWSPYYALSVKEYLLPPAAQQGPGDTLLGFDVAVNGSFHQSTFDFRPETRALMPGLDALYRAYAIPYDFYRARHGGAPQTVLVVGAGTGNDVAVALQQGASRVDAVEIDPAILRLGVERHPNQVYADPRVQRHVADARTFLQTTPHRYDLVIFGTLDSQIALSALSTIRLDNYVYTVESLRQARRVLAPDGMVGLYFWAEQPWIQARLVATVTEAFGHPPEISLDPSPSLFNLVLMAPAAPDVIPSPASEAARRQLAAVASHHSLPTDDWPYLYQQHRAVSPFYLRQITLLALLSALLLALTITPRGAPGRGGIGANLPLFLQGAAFLLLETRAISLVPLLFGATWTVNAVVIVAVLLLIGLANLAVRTLALRDLRTPFIGLAASLLVSYAFPLSILLTQGVAVRLVGAALLSLSPIFFSSLIFGVLLTESRSLRAAYGANLLGAVVGGLGEYIAVVTGLRALSLIALALFVPILILHRRPAVAPLPHPTAEPAP